MRMDLMYLIDLSNCSKAREKQMPIFTKTEIVSLSEIEMAQAISEYLDRLFPSTLAMSDRK